MSRKISYNCSLKGKHQPKRRIMKQRHSWLAGVGIIVAMFTFIACQDDKEEDTLSYPTALVTVKPNLGNTAFTLQLDDSVSLTPYNMKPSPFGMKEMRALVNYNVVDGPAVKEGKDRVKGTTYVNINWLDSIRTKVMAKNLGDANAKTYGNDPLEVVNDWVSIAEDGYLTLRFRTRWGGKVKHVLNLVTTPDKDNAYKVTLYHDAKGDLFGRWGDGLIAFRLAGLPDTGKKYVLLTLEWESYSGKKIARFKYATREATIASQSKMAILTAPVQITSVD